MKKEYRMKDFMLSFIKKHLFMVIVLCLLMMLCALAELLPPFALCYLIDSTGLKKNQFNIGHYDTPSTIELGRRFAREFLAHSEAGK